MQIHYDNLGYSVDSFVPFLLSKSLLSNPELSYEPFSFFPFYFTVHRGSVGFITIGFSLGQGRLVIVPIKSDQSFYRRQIYERKISYGLLVTFSFYEWNICSREKIIQARTIIVEL